MSAQTLKTLRDNIARLTHERDQERASADRAEARECTVLDAVAKNTRARLDAEDARDAAEKLGYMGDHHFPDQTWKARCMEEVAERRKAEKQAERLAEALKTLLPEEHYGAPVDKANCSQRCVLDADMECVTHRPDLAALGADACLEHPALDDADDGCCARCVILAALAPEPATVTCYDPDCTRTGEHVDHAKMSHGHVVKWADLDKETPVASAPAACDHTGIGLPGCPTCDPRPHSMGGPRCGAATPTPEGLDQCVRLYGHDGECRVYGEAPRTVSEGGVRAEVAVERMAASTDMLAPAGGES
jgi:hypothetical protein